MNEDRIRKTQKEIQEILPPKPQYVVTTSEYTDARNRLLSIENRRKSQERDDGRPHLRTNPSGSDGKPEGDDRPTIRRRDLVD
jgi:hypothetical protein